METKQLVLTIRAALARGVAEASIYGDLKKLGYSPRQVLEASLLAKHPASAPVQSPTSAS